MGQTVTVPEDQPKLSVIVVSYNTAEMTLACIRSIYDQAWRSDFEVIVLDNASSDNSADLIAAAHPKVRLIRSDSNLGFAGGNNAAVVHARGEMLLLLNPDTVVLDHAIDRLLAFAERHAAAKIWGGRTLFADRSLNPSSCWRFISLWSLLCQALGLAASFSNSPLFNSEGYGGWKRDREREVDIVTGCFLLIKREFWHSLDGFDESFFMYGEDADLCYRARKSGARPVITPDAVIVHHGGASERVFSGKVLRLFSGKAHFLHKHWSVGPRVLGICLMRLGALIRARSFAVAAALTAQERYRAAAAEWRVIWRARSEWSLGYGPSKERAR